MMAAPKLSLCADQYCCPVCLEVLEEPVTIPCGHSYCMHCIHDYWDQSDRVGAYNCPQCRRTFNVRPELNKSTVLTELIKQLKEVSAVVSPSESYAGPDDVCCDFCAGRKLRAVKTCLTCMASYCENHLQPHREHEALKRHKLEQPTIKLEEKLCTKHQKVLEIFCRTDETCICLMCAVTDHKSHNTVTAEEERAVRQNLLEERMAELKKKIEEKEKKLMEVMETIDRIQRTSEREVREHEETFNSVLQAIERLRTEVTEVIKDYERRKVTKAKEVMEQLEQEVKELKWREANLAELAELSQIDDHIHVLKKLPSLPFPIGNEDTTDVGISGDLLPETLRMSLSELEKSLRELSSWEFVKASEAGHILQNLRTKNGLLKYCCQPTLDSNSAHRCLRLSEGNSKVTRQDTMSSYPAHPDRFDFFVQVLGREALSGSRCYWEVEWSGRGVGIGVTYGGIKRKGDSQECHLGRNDRSWNLFCCHSSYSVWHNNLKTKIRAPSAQRIGVYLDWPAGSLSFYRISDTMTLLHRFSASFSEPLYLGFVVRPNSGVTVCPLSSPD
ncbi:tripartite motif-containing protein 16-like [Erpetoichthys calabaricus]|uniref:tripartite motif-containing protein 16-like n=1 Tax=Erpetoichthys calabaricus TaxID=27687 RepID=UPI0022340420|nr:tripartite motif-containing protein 16-like [Erpetoichthys calabaricus]